MLVTLAKTQKGETVLVHGAGSGVGSAPIRIAKMIGTRVITTAGSNDKLAKAKLLGADELINYREKDFVEEVKRLTDKRGVDIVFEHIGGEVLEKSITVMAKGGVSLHAVQQRNSLRRSISVMSTHDIFTIYGSWMGGKPELVEVLKFFEGGAAKRKLHPVIDSIFPLSQAADAHRRVEERKNFGKVVLEI